MAQITCVCPPKAGEVRHPEGDTVGLRAKLDFKGALTARNAVVLQSVDDPDGGAAAVMATLSEVYLLHGIESWSLVDDKGKPLPVSAGSIRELILADPEIGMVVADEADQLYSEAVMRPLLALVSNSSPPTPIRRSTSATNGRSPARPKPSRPSSTSTTPTEDTEPTSPLLAGASRS